MTPFTPVASYQIHSPVPSVVSTPWYAFSKWDMGHVGLPCLQSDSCPGGRCVCPRSAPGCAARSSSGSSPTPFSSSPPLSKTEKKKKPGVRLFSPPFQIWQTVAAYRRGSKKINKTQITSWYFFVCQLFHRSQWSSNCGSRLGAERAALRHTAITARGSIVASYWEKTGQQVRTQFFHRRHGLLTKGVDITKMPVMQTDHLTTACSLPWLRQKWDPHQSCSTHSRRYSHSATGQQAK